MSYNLRSYVLERWPWILGMKKSPTILGCFFSRLLFGAFKTSRGESFWQEANIRRADEWLQHFTNKKGRDIMTLIDWTFRVFLLTFRLKPDPASSSKPSLPVKRSKSMKTGLSSTSSPYNQATTSSQSVIQQQLGIGTRFSHFFLNVKFAMKRKWQCTMYVSIPRTI